MRTGSDLLNHLEEKTKEEERMAEERENELKSSMENLRGLWQREMNTIETDIREGTERLTKEASEMFNQIEQMTKYSMERIAQMEMSLNRKISQMTQQVEEGMIFNQGQHALAVGLISGFVMYLFK